MKASDFKEGQRVHDTDIVDNGTVKAVTETQVFVEFDKEPGYDFPFDEDCDLICLAHGEYK